MPGQSLDSKRFVAVFASVKTMSVVQIKVVYSSYSTERVTPIFLSEEELLELNYDAFKRKIVNDIPHIGKATDVETLRLTVMDQGYHLDISSAYFQHQI